MAVLNGVNTLRFLTICYVMWFVIPLYELDITLYRFGITLCEFIVTLCEWAIMFLCICHYAM